MRTPGDSSKLILLVEDEKLVALSERLILENGGYDVTLAATGEEALELVREDDAIELVLMDIDLGGGIDGTEAAEEILKIRELPVVFLTAHSEEEMVARVKGITRYGYVLKNAGRFVLLESVSMAFELFESHRAMAEEIEVRRAAEQLLADRNIFIETILDNLPIGLAVNYIDEGRATYMNRRFTEIYGWPQEVLVDIPSVFEHVYPDPEYRRELMNQVLADLDSEDPERMQWENLRITRQDGSEASVSAKNIPIYDQNFMISTVQDTTERVATSALYRNILESANEGVLLVDPKGRIVETNRAYCDITGFSRDELITMTISDIDAQESREDTAAHLGAVGAHGGDRFMTRHRCKNGSLVDVDVSASAVPQAGGMIVSFVRDASELRKAQEALSEDNQALQEEVHHQAVLNREINHRVKNNLSLITSLLHLKQDGLPEGVDLSDIIHRIEAIRILYDQLQLGEATSEVVLGRYLSEILGKLFTSLSAENVDLAVSADELYVSPRMAVPLGIIANEIATNAVKHAFGPQGPRRFSLNLEVDDALCTLRLANSGEPLPAHFALDDTDSLGMRIVSGLVEQIRGSIEVIRSPETTFVIRFPRQNGAEADL